MRAGLRASSHALLRPYEIFRTYRRADLLPDLLAGATVGVVLLPQGLAFALLAGLPPEMGLYAAVAGAIGGALWGSSNHLQTGPTNTASALTLSVLLPIAAPGSPEFIAAAGLVAVLAGLFRLAMGLARLGVLVNFVSDSVVVGFTAGAGALIIASQIGTLLGVAAPPAQDLLGMVGAIVPQLPLAHPPTIALGMATLLLLIVLRRIPARYPLSLAGIIGAAVVAYLLGLEGRGVRTIGAIPANLPPLAALPLDLSLIGQLSTGALAIAAIGLVEATAIARALATNSGQRLDSNQEFVGQGISNIAAGVFSGYPCSASFNRSALSFRTGARTPLASAFAGGFVLIASLLLASVITHLPRAVVAAELVLAAYSMIDRRRMLRIWRGARGDTAIMLVTFAATLLLPLQFAVLIGILMSLGYYIMQTSTPQVVSVVPDAAFRHWVGSSDRPNCPQLGVVDVLGDLYFGAVGHVEDAIRRLAASNPNQRFLILRMHSVQRCDITGITVLESLLRLYRSRGGDLFFVRVREPVQALMKDTGFLDQLGPGHLLAEDAAIGHLFHKVLDPAVCIYECDVRVFRECQNLPKQELPGGIPLISGPMPDPADMAPRDLWRRIHTPDPPLLIDVREPREFRQGHVPGAQLMPLAKILSEQSSLPRGQEIVLICRSGRRSARAAAILAAQGYTQLAVLRGGMLGWQADSLLEAIE
jgi:sulfate permease, SulP family